MSKKIKLLNLNACQKLTLKEIQRMYYNYINPGLSDSLKVFSFGNDLVSSAYQSTIKLKNKRKILDFTGGLGVLNFGHNPQEVLKERKPEYIIILPWNIAKEVMDKYNYVKEWGAKFVTAVPELRVIG